MTRKKEIISKRAENCCVGKLESVESHGWRRGIEMGVGFVSKVITGNGKVIARGSSFYEGSADVA